MNPPLVRRSTPEAPLPGQTCRPPFAPPRRVCRGVHARRGEVLDRRLWLRQCVRHLISSRAQPYVRRPGMREFVGDRRLNVVVGTFDQKPHQHATDWQGRHIEIALDEVARVGLFVEIELVTHEEDADGAREAIKSLADQLGLTRSERRSYLEMLLEAER